MTAPVPERRVCSVIRPVMTSARDFLFLLLENILVFRDAPLTDVLLTLERNYNVTFHISNEAVKGYSYSLKAKTDEPIESILKDIENISNIRFENKGDKIFVYSK